jgi:hypothetical protein
VPKAKRKNLQVVIDIKEKNENETTVEITYKNTETATDNEKVTGANIYNTVCNAIQNLK